MDYKVTDTELTSIANAIRTKGSTQSPLAFPTGFVNAVNAIPTGGGGGGEYHRIRYYDSDGDILFYTEYFLDGSHPTKIGAYAAEPNGTTPVDLSLVSTSIDVYEILPENYHSSNDGKIGVLVYDDYSVWFFKNYSKTAGDILVPEEIREYTPASSLGVVQSKSYNSQSSDTWMCNLGFYNGYIRSWPKNNGSVIAVDDVWAVVEAPKQSWTQAENIEGAWCQTTDFMLPTEYYALHPIESD